MGRLFGAPDGTYLKRALLYFGAAFSAAIILNKIGFVALGIEEIAEVWYWLFHTFADAGRFHSVVAEFRRRVMRDFCGAVGRYFNRLGINHFWVLQYADTDLAETVVVGADQCTR